MLDTHCPHILFGDIFQPTPVLGHLSRGHPFGQQASVSLFQRLLLGGADAVWLWEQHQSNIDIIALTNYVLPRGRLRVAPYVKGRPESALATRCALEIFGSSRRVVFMNVRGVTDILSTSKSRYNHAFILVALKVCLCVVEKGCFKGAQVAIISAYTAQVAAYRYVKQ